MVAQKAVAIIVISACFLLARGTAIGRDPVPPKSETKEFNQDFAAHGHGSILNRGVERDLAKYETFANEIEQMAGVRQGYHARLMAAICKTLTGGQVEWAGVDPCRRLYEICGKYARLAFANRDAIPLALELELKVRPRPGLRLDASGRPDKGSRGRKGRPDIMLHAWKRLNVGLTRNGRTPSCRSVEGDVFAAAGLPVHAIQRGSGSRLPASTKPLKRRTKRRWRYQEQRKCSIWRTVRKTMGDEIIGLYSLPPYDVAELKKGLDA